LQIEYETKKGDGESKQERKVIKMTIIKYAWLSILFILKWS